MRLSLLGDTYADASKAAVLDASRTGAALALAFDGPRVIVGQDTVTREILADLGRAPDILLVPVGGGGLLAGALLALAEAPAEFAADRCRVIAVEPGRTAHASLT